ncbi:NPCBM/NEW2 domain-containing protein, partial [Actinocorallia lasiicapitis]
APTPSATITETAAPTAPVSVAPGRLPDLRGKSLTEVRAALPVSVNVQTELTPAPAGTPDGVVLGQDPEPGGAMPASVKVTVSSSKPITYLADLSPTSGELYDTNDGEKYLLSGSVQPHALGAGGSCYNTERLVEYDLGSHYERLIGVVGIDDTSPNSKGKVNLEVYGDGTKLATLSATLGKPADLNVSMTGVLRLRFRWVMTDCAGRATFVLGNGQLVSADGYKPNPFPTDGAGE